jgi:hypothetical protein
MHEKDGLSLRFGVEEEKFLFFDGCAPTVSQYNSLFRQIGSYAPFKLTEVPTSAGMLFQAELSTPSGPLTIKHDYCTHLLEIAYPPCESHSAFTSLYDQVWGRLRDAASVVSGEFTDGSYLSTLPTGFMFAEINSTIKRTIRLVHRHLPKSALAAPHFLAQMAATQVTLEISDQYLFANYRSIYSLLYLVPLLFSEPFIVGNKNYRAIRPLVYRDNLPGHPLAGVPPSIPTDRSAYQQTLLQIPGALRDYSFVASRAGGLVEFRIGCAQDSSIRISRLVALIHAIVLYAPYRQCDDDPATTLYDYCEFGTLAETAAADLLAVKRIIDGLPTNYRVPTEFLEDRT